MATEKKIKLLEGLLQMIDARRRTSDLSPPAPSMTIQDDIPTVEVPKEKLIAEKIPYFPEEDELKPSAAFAASPPEEKVALPPFEEKVALPPFEEKVALPPLEEPAVEKPASPVKAPGGEEEEGEVTDRIQVIPTITPKMIQAAAEKTEKEEMTLPWFGEPADLPQTQEPEKTREIDTAPASPVAPVEIVAPVVISKAEEEEERTTDPEVISAQPAIAEAKPFAITGSLAVKPKLTIGQLLKNAFTIGEH